MTHYQALELSENAPAADIRRAYRRLVLLTHPDRTPDPAAHARYLAINAAYETLSDPARRQAYDLALHGGFTAPEPAMSPGQARDARHRAHRKTRSARQGRSPSYEAIYLHYAPLGQQACRILVLFGLLFGADRLLVRVYPHEVVLSADSRIVYSRRGNAIGSITTVETPNATFHSDWAFNEGDVLVLRRTPLFRQVISRHLATDNIGEEGYERTDTLYRGAGALLPATMLLTAAVGAWPGKAGRRQVDCALTAGILAVIILWMLMRN